MNREAPVIITHDLVGGNVGGKEAVKPVLYHNGEYIEPLPVYDLRVTDSYLFELPEPTGSFQIRFLQQDSIPQTFILNGFIPEKNTPGIVYHSIGVNGASVPSYLECEYFEDELTLINPDLVIFGIGINDATKRDFSIASFVDDYNQLIQRIERVNPDCAFVFITNNDSYRRVRRNTYQVNTNGSLAMKAFFEIAQTHQGAVWDLFSLMGGLRSMQKWEVNKLSKRDKVHFTTAGYELLGDLLYNALIDYYLQYDNRMKQENYDN